MPGVREQFIDPAGNRTTYSWVINHSDEDEFGKERQINHGANTANTGLVKQQSDDSPMVLRLQGTILHKAQHTEFIAWWKLSETQTIHFVDFTGDRYEVIVTAFKPIRKRTIKNPRDYPNAPYWYWTYSMELEVISFVSSVWSGVTP